MLDNGIMLNASRNLSRDLQRIREWRVAEEAERTEQAVQAEVTKAIDTVWVPFAGDVAKTAAPELSDDPDYPIYVSPWTKVGGHKGVNANLQAQVRRTEATSGLGTRQVYVYLRLAEKENDEIATEPERVLEVLRGENEINVIDNNGDEPISSPVRPDNEVAWRELQATTTELRTAFFKEVGLSQLPASA